MLKRQGLIEAWHDRRIGAGTDIDGAIDSNLEESSIILLLISPDFLASDYCYDLEMGRAMELHREGRAKVIPVILRDCDWKQASFGKLLAVPKDGKPVTHWPDRDSAFLDVVRAIREAVGTEKSEVAEYKHKPASDSVPPSSPIARSSNLRLKKDFSERDRDKFKVETFGYMCKFFESSLSELEARNDGIECEFRKVDANRFTSTIYQHGNAVARCTIFMGGDRYLGRGISFVHGETSESNSYNEALSVSSDDIEMFLTSTGMAAVMSGGGSKKLTQQGASELYWSMLIQPLQT